MPLSQDSGLERAIIIRLERWLITYSVTCVLPFSTSLPFPPTSVSVKPTPPPSLAGPIGSVHGRDTIPASAYRASRAGLEITGL